MKNTLLGQLIQLQRLSEREKVIGELKGKLEDLLPSGSGIDCGTKIDLEKSRWNKIVLTFSFHHMDEHGGYCEWSNYKAVIRPDWQGIRVEIFGKNKNGILDYLGDLYHHALTVELSQKVLDEINAVVIN